MHTIIQRRVDGRFYDSHKRRYVSLDDIGDMVGRGVAVEVIDKKTGEDLTNAVLAEVIMSKEKTIGEIAMDAAGAIAGQASDLGTDMKQRARTLAAAAANTIGRGVDQVKPYTEPVTEAVGDAYRKVDGLLDRAGVKETAEKITDTVSEQLDVVSGKKILDEVRRRLTTQDKYNDVLATKLFEALERIKILEQKLGIEK
jgi:hypothetical protein